MEKGDSSKPETASRPTNGNDQPRPAQTAPRTDRRERSLRSLLYGAFNPRRRRFRRDGDANTTFLDWHPRHLLLVSAVVMALSVADGLFTIYLIDSGLQELNPVLAPLVNGNAAAFAMVKIAFTGVGVIALVISAHAKIWRRLTVSRIFYCLAFAYLCVVAYEIHLMQLI